MEFIKYKYADIGKRIKQRRKEMGLKIEEIVIEDDENWNNDRVVPHSVVSTIENGRLYGKNKNFISNKYLEIFQEVLEMSREEIIFGSDFDVEKFMEEIFFIVGFNIHPTFADDEYKGVLISLTKERPVFGDYFMENKNYCDNKLIDEVTHFHEELSKSTKIIQEVARFSAYLSFSECYIKSGQKVYTGYDDGILAFLKGEALAQSENTTLKEYYNIISYLLCICRTELLNSFRVNVIEKSICTQRKNRGSNFPKLLEVDRFINDWIKKDFCRVIKEFEKVLRDDDIFGIGYLVSDAMLPMSEFINDFFLEIYRCSKLVEGYGWYANHDKESTAFLDMLLSKNEDSNSMKHPKLKVDSVEIREKKRNEVIRKTINAKKLVLEQRELIINNEDELIHNLMNYYESNYYLNIKARG